MRRRPDLADVDRPKSLQECLHHFLLTAVLIGIGSLVIVVDVCLAIVTMGRSCGPIEH